jgi:hypothetical protein
LIQNHRDTYLEKQEAEKIETEVKNESIQVYATLSRVSFWDIPFTQIIYYSPPADSPPSKKETPR